jgi:hypothetical protein
VLGGFLKEVDQESQMTLSLPGPFGAPVQLKNVVKDNRSVQDVTVLRNDPRFNMLKVALVDLSQAGQQFFVGWNEWDMEHVFSVVKIAAMFAAFRLRKQFREAANAVPLLSLPKRDEHKPAGLIQLVRSAWTPIINQAVANGGPKDFPNLAKVFNIHFTGGGFDIEFTKQFNDDMFQMIASSDDPAASRCIFHQTGLGNQYINGALATEGFYDPNQGGLWLGGDYGGHQWKAEPKVHTTQGATAIAVAFFFTLLAGRALVGPDESNDMLGILQATVSPPKVFNSFFFEALFPRLPAPPPAGPVPMLTTATKFGFPFNGGPLNEGGLIFRTRQGQSHLTYVAVGLGAPRKEVLKELIVALDNYLDAVN